MEFLFLMHNDYHVEPEDSENWGPYLASLTQKGVMRGGSAFGEAVCARKPPASPQQASTLVGYIKVAANDVEEAKQLLRGNPVFEAGGTIEIRELTIDG
ncbi:MAG: hypothetical protein ABJN26_15345 [Stappiaceae bacterium]